MRIAIGSDHVGFELGRELVEALEASHDIVHVGADSTTRVDYPVYALRVAGRVQSGTADRGILICGSGVGMQIMANRLAGVRAVVGSSVGLVRAARSHNDVNVLCLGSRFSTPQMSSDLVHAFLTSEFEGGRHSRRIEQLDARDSHGS